VTGDYLNAVYTKYISGNNFYGLSNGADPVSVNLDSYTIPMSPKFKTTASVYYDWNLGKYGTISPYFNWVFSSSYYTTDYNTPLDRQKSYDTFDMSVRWTSENGKYYGEIYGTNITDVPVLMSGVVGRDERIQVSYGAPALYGFRVGAKF
jgi:iron complex outermembrane receptor protein